MFRNFSFYLRSTLAVGLISSFYLACSGAGGGDCKSNNDCKAKGADYVCKADAKTGNLTCVKSTTNSNDNNTNNNTNGNGNNTNGNNVNNNKPNNNNNTINNNPNNNNNNTINNNPNNNTNTNVCTKDADCKASETCQGGKCMPKTTTGCKSDADCAGGQTCNTATGVCGSTTGPKKKLGEECGQTIGECDTGLLCIGNSVWAQYYCFKDCKADAAVCSGGTVCIQASSTLSICAKEANSGEACDYAGATTQALCKAGQKPPLYCSKSTKKCTAFKLLNEGDKCDDTTTEPLGICDTDKQLACSSGKCTKVADVGKYEPCGAALAKQCRTADNLECILTSQNSGHCFTKCTTGSPQCGAGETCQALQQGSSDGVCIPAGSNDYGTVCGVGENDKYDPAKLCKQDLSCVNFGRRICIELAQGNCQSYQCKMTGAKCVDLSAGSTTYAGCFRPCTADTDCTSETFCRDLQTAGKVCWPKNPPGDVLYGGVCKTSAATSAERCKEPNICLQTNAESGYCTTTCNADTDCAAAPSGTGLKSTCAPISSTSKLCVFDCSAAGATCPTGLQCEDVQGTKICVPPTPLGPNDFQQKCNNQQPIATAGCKQGMSCIATTQTGDGICTKTCAANSDCTVGATTASCIKGLLQDPNTGLCVIPCGQPGQTCPTGLQCRTFGSNSLCAP